MLSCLVISIRVKYRSIKWIIYLKLVCESLIEILKHLYMLLLLLKLFLVTTSHHLGCIDFILLLLQFSAALHIQSISDQVQITWLIYIDFREQRLDSIDHYIELGLANFLNYLYLLPGLLSSSLRNLRLSYRDEDFNSFGVREDPLVYKTVYQFY